MKKTLLLLFFFYFLNNNAQCWQQIDAGGFFTVGLKDDGTIWGWGHSWSGELGNNTYDYYTATPVQIGTDADWAYISAGNGHVMGLKANGTLWAWGRNDSGQLGNGDYTTYSNHIPQQVGTDTDWAYISAGHIHSCAIKTNGTLWTWGANQSGQLGNGTIDVDFNPVITPLQVGTDTDWKMVCGSSDNTVAIKTNGTLWVTGEGNHGEIGNGFENDQVFFTQAGTDTDWDTVTFGGFAGAALKTNGTLWSWGWNTYGELGSGSIGHILSPVMIAEGKWQSVVKGMNYFTGAIKADGSLWTWGYNYYGAVGNGQSYNFGFGSTVTQLYQIPSEGGWQSYQGGGDYSVALKEDGSLWAWGYNYYGELGFNLEGNIVDEPVQVMASCRLAAAIATNQKVTLAVYPNPAQGTLHLSGIDGAEIEDISITDALGKTVLTHKGYTSELNVAQLPAGIYFLKAETRSGVLAQKFIKQ